MARRAFPAKNFYAFDWAFSAASLLDGEHVQSDAMFLNRKHTPSEKYISYVRRDNSAFLVRLMPLLPMTRELLRQPDPALSINLRRSLLRLNLVMHESYTDRCLPQNHRRSRRVLQSLIHNCSVDKPAKRSGSGLRRNLLTWQFGGGRTTPEANTGL